MRYTELVCLIHGSVNWRLFWNPYRENEWEKCNQVLQSRPLHYVQYTQQFYPGRSSALHLNGFCHYSKQSSPNFSQSLANGQIEDPYLHKWGFDTTEPQLSPHQQSEQAWHLRKSDCFSCFCPAPTQRMLSVHSKLLCQAVHLRPSL